MTLKTGVMMLLKIIKIVIKFLLYFGSNEALVSRIYFFLKYCFKKKKIRTDPKLLNGSLYDNLHISEMDTEN